MVIMPHKLLGALCGSAVVAASALMILHRRHQKRERKPGHIGFIGLGNMGAAMALRLHSHLDREHGEPLVVWNRTTAKAKTLAGAGAEVASSVEQLFEQCDTVCAMLLGDAAVESIVGTLAGLDKSVRRCRTFISLSTISPACAVQATEVCKKCKVRFVCSPVTGRPEAAARGQLVAWVSSANGAAADLAATLVCPAMARHAEVLSTKDATAAATYKLLVRLVDLGLALIQAPTRLTSHHSPLRAAHSATGKSVMSGLAVESCCHRPTSSSMGAASFWRRPRRWPSAAALAEVRLPSGHHSWRPAR